ncbi:MAG TPA: serine hydrolase domain-containing protein [Acidobacteriaceae bacterium]|nr:serine hydrolase domain-containing protein [Acidobacteriaceae bacterium]
MGYFYDSNIPNDAHTFISNCMGGPGVSVVAFTPSGGWVAVAPNGAYEAEGIPQDCFTTLGSFITNGWTVRSIAFPAAGGDSWVIIADQGYEAHNIPNDCFQMIGTLVSGGSRISCVAFPPSGSDSWVIIANNALYAHNIDDQCFQTLCNYTQTSQRATQVAFAPNGGWVVYGARAYFAVNIPNACYQQIQTFENDNWLVEHVAFTPSSGWSVICNDPLPPTPDPLRTFEDFFLQETGEAWQTIYDRMGFWGVPGASVALVLNNQVAWRTSYGVLQTGGAEYVYTNTPFQAASISKPHTSIGVQVLTQQNSNVKLGDTVSSHTTWTIPVRSCAQAGWAGQATIQLTLQHQGGFIGRGNTYPLNVCTNLTANEGGGFGGYPNVAGTVIPTLNQILAGTNPPANSPPIEITTQPGTFYYSGMGYVVLMRMLQDVTGADFRTWMQQSVLTPLGMNESTFDLNLPANLSRAAVGHDANVQPIAGMRNLYPEASAAGLYTNAGDLCQTIIMLNSGGQINGKQVLTAAQASAMISQQIGIFNNGEASNQTGYMFNHNGENYGFTALIQGYPNQGAGMAVMTNRDNSDGHAASFYTEVVNALIRVYGLKT